MHHSQLGQAAYAPLPPPPHIQRRIAGYWLVFKFSLPHCVVPDVSFIRSCPCPWRSMLPLLALLARLSRLPLAPKTRPPHTSRVRLGPAGYLLIALVTAAVFRAACPLSIHTQADGSRLLELRNSLGHQTARQSAHLFAGQISTPISTSTLRPLGSSFERLSDGFVTWSMLLGTFLSFRNHPAGDANGTGFAPLKVVPFLGPSRPNQLQRASTHNPSIPVCILRTNAIQHSAHDWSCFAVLTFELETVFGIRIHPPSSASSIQAIRLSHDDPFEIGGEAPSARDGGQIFCTREKRIREVRQQNSWLMGCGCATAGALTLNILRRSGLITADDDEHALPMSDDKKFRRNVPPKRSLALAAAGIVPRRRGAVEWSSSDRNVPCSRTRRRITKTDRLRKGGYKSAIHHQDARNSNRILRPSKVQGQITPFVCICLCTCTCFHGIGGPRPG
ncbi:hypothetical protein CSAL01_04498 [Colletotrichum salicis]|uniref:Uncharacterized protein n=1 Tax=Colletotrichum salicis TaxID=1209931 RepID=A0A135UAY4_9PEZI|nr:hypothetical protein CSAL01_04498 [Colletotrichum salicis]